MYRYAKVVDGVVSAVRHLAAEGMEQVDQSLVPDPESAAELGGIWDGSAFGPAPPPTTLTISLDATEVAVGTEVTATAEVRDSSGSLVLVDGTYYVPVVGIDGRQQRLLTVAVAGGQGSASWVPAAAGIYTVRTGLIRPRPEARLAVAPELIVTE